MSNRLYAHSRKGQPPETWQPLDEHLHAVARRGAEFATSFSSSDWAWNAGWLHDLGKATNAFQKYLLRCNELDDSDYDADGSESNHASTGAAFAEDVLKLPGRTLAYLLAGHHAGLPDWHSAETGNAALPCRLPEGRKNLTFIRAYAEEIHKELRPLARPPDFVRQPERFHFWMRMIFSCLVDADFLNTEEDGDPSKAALRGVFPNLGSLADRFFQALEKLETDAVRSDVNKIRAEIRRACEAAAARPSGLFSLTVPTGGGKTLSAMAFALRHALQHGKQRVIYVIPYTSIIEQTANILASIFGREQVVEHHSNLAPARETERSQMAAENWDAPIIVTTNVQFFESLYAAKPGRCRKLHNLVNSVVVLDEAQLLPPELLTPCLDALNQLVQCYRVTLVLATATQPALPKLLPATEIIPANMRLYERLKRTDILLPKDMKAQQDWPAVADQLQQHEQVLCVVNTRRDCYDLFKLMPAGTIHLSALMCGAHRSTVIRWIKARLRRGLPTRVISTQLVEAGVDLDFPAVYRALAGLPSIAQAAGRCNREGKLNASAQLGQVHVFVPPKPAPPGLLRKGEDVTKEMSALPGFDPQQPETFTRYFELLYPRLNDTGSEFHDLLVRDVNPKLEIQFRTAAAEFKLIDDKAQQAVLVDYGRCKTWLDQVRTIGPTRKNMRALQRNTVNISKPAFDAAVRTGFVAELAPGVWLWQGAYKRDTGLDLFGEVLSPEDLIV